MSTSPSLRKLAQKLGLSHTTVSEALRGCARVKEETRQKVMNAANAMGYQRNPLAGALMSEMRRSRSGTFRGVLGVVDLDSPQGRGPGPAKYHAELTQGAIERAEELGFKADVFAMGAEGLSPERLDNILQSRGIQGLFMLPVREVPDFTRLGWSHFSGIYSDYVIGKPGLNTICPDHYRSMFTALERVHALGYKRPGIVLNTAHDSRLLFRWEAAYNVYQTHHDGMSRITPLVQSELNEEDFTRWFKTMKCDVVMSHDARVLGWMKAAGAKVPETHGYCSLNVVNCQSPCAGLDLQPRLLGRRGVQLLISQVLCNEVGAPEHPMISVLPAIWIDGPTVRRMERQAGGRRSLLPTQS